MMSARNRIYILLCCTVAVFIGVFSTPRMPQDPRYHLFADNRTFFGIPNFFNVLSNVPFLIAGILGLTQIIQDKNPDAFRQTREQWPYFVFFLGFALTCLGSGYYHWSPGNNTLLWDRMAMAVVCMGILSGTMSDRIGSRAGVLGLLPMLAFGICSVVYWYAGELKGFGDLRLYIIVQFYTLAAIVLLVVLFPARYTHSGWLLAGGAVYMAAKILEIYDKPIFSLVKIGGHTFKHLSASLAAFFVWQMLRKRKLVNS